MIQKTFSFEKKRVIRTLCTAKIRHFWNPSRKRVFMLWMFYVILDICIGIRTLARPSMEWRVLISNAYIFVSIHICPHMCVCVYICISNTQTRTQIQTDTDRRTGTGTGIDADRDTDATTGTDAGTGTDTDTVTDTRKRNTNFDQHFSPAQPSRQVQWRCVDRNCNTLKHTKTH